MKAERVLVLALLASSASWSFAQVGARPTPPPVPRVPTPVSPAVNAPAQTPGMISPTGQPIGATTAPIPPTAPSPLRPLSPCNLTAGSLTGPAPTVLLPAGTPTPCGVSPVAQQPATPDAASQPVAPTASTQPLSTEPPPLPPPASTEPAPLPPPASTEPPSTEPPNTEPQN
jgi:hypothetical protein